MGFFQTLLQNKMLIAAVIGWTVAQVSKTLLVLLLDRELRWERLVGSGGMPSSHSATVCALASSAAMVHGLDSGYFAIAAIFAFIVMYDACNVRLETGKQAAAINELHVLLQKMGEDLTPEEKLKELVGHTFPQVLVGAALGIAIGILIPMWI
ncbi:MAG: divergent PAP2 family protein [Oscillospiraceae bacterium]|nr:divergent PAP2 family protein [Oscillospiraceae bacterium]